MSRRVICVVFAFLLSLIPATAARAELRAGAYAVDITPKKFPVTINGNFTPTFAQRATSPLHARCLVLDDGKVKLLICVVDTCLLPGDLVDEIKKRASASTGISVDRMSISATHTHSAPALMSLAGVEVDPNYPAFFVPRVIEGIERATKNLRPVKVGFAAANNPEQTHCRQWIYRPDRMLTDPYGEQTVRVNMHPGFQNASTIGPAGPADPGLSLLSFQTPEGKPVALLANYSMHYFGSDPASADYFGLFCRKMQARLAPDDPSFMVALSQGTSGDLQWMDYERPDPRVTLEQYTDAMVKRAEEAYRSITHTDGATVGMAETDLRLRMRTPDAKRLAWAQAAVGKFKGRLPQTWPEAYAVEAIYLHEHPERDVKLQAIRIGNVGIATASCEVFGITGLKLKAQSPLPNTFNIELANDIDGYIPPRELHAMGGYTTWPSRWAGLEVEAETKIVDGLLGLLEKVSGKPRRPRVDTHGEYAKTIIASKPLAYWRLNEWGGDEAADAVGNLPATHETGVLFYLDGPKSEAFSGPRAVNRAPHFAGGRMRVRPEKLGDRYSLEVWFWNGLANEARAVTGYLFSRGADGADGAPGDHLAIAGTAINAQGKLAFFNGNRLNTLLVGTTLIEPKTWNHVVYVRDGRRVTVYLNGNAAPEIEGEAEVGHPPAVTELFLGGRNDGMFGLEGRIDEVALYDRPLTANDAAAHHAAAGLGAAGPLK